MKHAEELDAFDVFELILWIIWIYSIKGTLLWSVFSTDVRPVFGYLGFSIEASGLPQDAFGPMGKQVREVMRCQMMPRGGGQGGQLNHGGRWLKKCWKCSKPNDKRFFGETADCLFLGFTTLDVSNGFCGSGLVPAALPQLGLGQTRGSVADIGGIDQAHEGCVPLEGHAGAGEIECIFLKNLICIQFGLAILKVQKWLRQGCLRFCNRRRQIFGLLVLGFVGRSSNVSSPKKIDSS